jgi:hypothetical protein
VRDPLDESRAPAQERRLDRQDHQDLGSPGRALDRQRRQRPGAEIVLTDRLLKEERLAGEFRHASYRSKS